jgi:hypothetical protein
MAGAIIVNQDRLIRLGQDFSNGYGSAITVSEIEELTSSIYSERKIGRIAMVNGKGPHTYATHKSKALVDWYTESFSALAGFRRLAAKFAAR